MERRIVVEPALQPNEARVYDTLPHVLFVGTRLAREDPRIAPRLIAQDRERLIQEQDQ